MKKGYLILLFFGTVILTSLVLNSMNNKDLDTTSVDSSNINENQTQDVVKKIDGFLKSITDNKDGFYQLLITDVLGQSRGFRVKGKVIDEYNIKVGDYVEGKLYSFSKEGNVVTINKCNYYSGVGTIIDISDGEGMILYRVRNDDGIFKVVIDKETSLKVGLDNAKNHSTVLFSGKKYGDNIIAKKIIIDPAKMDIE